MSITQIKVPLYLRSVLGMDEHGHVAAKDMTKHFDREFQESNELDKFEQEWRRVIAAEERRSLLIRRVADHELLERWDQKDFAGHIENHRGDEEVKAEQWCREFTLADVERHLDGQYPAVELPWR